MTSEGYYAHFCNWAQLIHHPLDPPDCHFPRIRSVNASHGFVGPLKSTSRRHLLSILWHSIASFDGLVMRQGQMMFGDRELNTSRYGNFFGGRIDWYTWGAVVQVRRCNLDRYVKCDWLS